MCERKPYGTIEELIPTWAEKTGKPIELLEEMLKLHLKYIEHLKYENKECINIRLPKVGVLRLNYHLLSRFLKVNRSNSKYIDNLKNKFQKLREIGKKEKWVSINFNRSLIAKSCYYIRGRDTIKDNFFVKYFVHILTLEDANNENFNKKFDKSG